MSIQDDQREATDTIEAGSDDPRLLDVLVQIGLHDHICLIYESQGEQLAMPVPSIRMGLERGEKCIFIAPEKTLRDVNEALHAIGIDVDEAMNSGRLAVASQEDTYLRNGHFEPDRMIRFLVDSLEPAIASGFSGLRVVGEMTWALGGDLGTGQLIEYEAKLNHFVHDHPVAVTCQYDRNRFSPEVILNVIRTHPIVIYGNFVCSNPYYVPPEEFLAPNHAEMEVKRLLANIRDREQAKIESKQAEERIHELGAIVESSDDAIFGKTLDGIITSWNKGAEKMYGYAENDVIGQPISILLPTDRRDEAPEILGRVAQGESISHYETAHRRKDGQEIQVSLTISPIRNLTGRIIGASAIARDVTERRQLEMQLRQAQKMEAIGQLAGGVAHDFNNLLAVVFGHTELLASASPSPQGLRDSLAQISRAAERGAALTRQLLTFSRRQAVEPRLLDLRVVVTESRNLLQRLIGEDVRLALILSPRLSAVRADPGQIDQVLMNLALNARDAMAQGGLLTIETGEVDLDALLRQDSSGGPPGPPRAPDGHRYRLRHDARGAGAHL
jgi:PAS domain S-box-containing protein